MKTLRKLFDPRVTDEKVGAIHAEANAIVEKSSQQFKSTNDLLKKNGVTLRIYIATGGGHHGN